MNPGGNPADVPHHARRLACQRALFDVPADIAYLNCAYISPLLRSAIAANRRGLDREAHPWEVQPADFFDPPDAARALFARLVNAGADDIAIVPSASYGVATAAANLPPARGQSIVVLQEQYPSNVYSWRRLAQQNGAELRTVARAATGPLTEAVLSAIGPDTAVVAVPNCHWMDGAVLDLEAIGAAARAVGAALVVDASQSLGALPLDVQRVRPDFLVSCGYKWLLCPYAISFLYAAPQRQEQGIPLEENPLNREQAQHFARLAEYREGYLPGARRFDMGERAQFTHLPAAIATLEQLLAWDVVRIEAALSAVTSAIAARASELGLASLPAERRAGHFLGLSRREPLPDRLAERLARENVYVSVRGNSVRVTPHLYVNDDDIERFFAVLARLL